MFTIQILWPFIGSCLIFKIETRPEEFVQLNMQVSFFIIRNVIFFKKGLNIII